MGTPARSDTLLLLVVGLLALAVGWHFVTPFHGWGDDWAGYVLQARAIESGAIADEMERNARLLQGGDRLLGPSAYPWGFPALLWMTGGATDLSLPAMKGVGAASLALTAAATFVLARLLMPSLPALIAVAGGVLQPILVLSVDEILSDLPFLAVSMLALVVTVLQWRHGQAHRTLRWDLTTAIVVLSVLGYSIRSTGVVIPLVYGLAIALLTVDGALPLAGAIRRLAWTAGCVLAAVLLYWVLIADGSLYALSYLSSSPTVIVGRLRFFAEQALLFAPFAHLPRPLQWLALAACLLLVVTAVRRGGRIALIVLGCCALHLVLLLAIDFVGYVRYLFPILPPVVVLTIAGAYWLAREWMPRFPRSASARGAVAIALLACIAGAQLWAAQADAARIGAQNREHGPMSTSALRAFAAAAAAAGPGGQVAFYKARAFRLLTGREAIVLTRPGRARRVGCHLLHLAPPGVAGGRQLPESALRDRGFAERFRNEHFALFCR